MFQGSSAGFSTVSYKMETRTEEEEDKEVDESSEVHGGDKLEQSSELITTDSLLKNPHGSFCSRYLLNSRKAQFKQTV